MHHDAAHCSSHCTSWQGGAEQCIASQRHIMNTNTISYIVRLAYWSTAYDPSQKILSKTIDFNKFRVLFWSATIAASLQLPRPRYLHFEITLQVIELISSTIFNILSRFRVFFNRLFFTKPFGDFCTSAHYYASKITNMLFSYIARFTAFESIFLRFHLPNFLPWLIFNFCFFLTQFQTFPFNIFFCIWTSKSSDSPKTRTLPRDSRQGPSCTPSSAQTRRTALQLGDFFGVSQPEQIRTYLRIDWNHGMFFKDCQLSKWDCGFFCFSSPSINQEFTHLVCANFDKWLLNCSILNYFNDRVFFGRPTCRRCVGGGVDWSPFHECSSWILDVDSISPRTRVSYPIF